MVRGLLYLALTVLAACMSLCGQAFAQDAAAKQDAPRPVVQFEQAEQLAAARAVLGATPELPPPDETAKALREILARPEFTQATSTPGDNWLLKLYDWLQSMFQRLGIDTPDWFGMVVIVFLAVALLYLIVRVVWEWQARRTRAVAADSMEEATPLGADALLKSVQAAVAGGDYRTAIRLRFRWLLSALDLGESAVLTNRQVLSRLTKERPGVKSPLQQLISCFEDVWYGGSSCGEAEYLQATGWAETVKAQYLSEAA